MLMTVIVMRNVIFLNKKKNMPISFLICRNLFKIDPLIPIDYREPVVDSVIQITGTVEFQDGLRTEVLPEDC